MQLAYDACVCAWQLALCPEGAAALDAAGAVKALVGVLQCAAKEKVVRGAGLALGALLAAGGGSGGAAVSAGLERVADSLLQQTWEDEDVTACLEGLRDAAAAARAAAATWEGYRAEVLSGALAWGPAHGSPDFWAAHAAKLEDRDLQACRVGGGGVGVGGGVGGGRGWAERWAVGGVG